MKLGEHLVCARRGRLVEHIHTGHIVAVDQAGVIRQYAGSPDAIVYARSAAKPLQAIPLMERIGESSQPLRLDDREIAVICASHSGEQRHREAVQSILAKIGAHESALRCGIHEPYDTATAHALVAAGLRPSLLHNNCSGKHAGMLALAMLLRADAQRYDAPDHPVQQLMLEAVASMANMRPDEVIIGTDGCGVPVFGLPLVALAGAFARFGCPDGLSERRRRACDAIVGALRREPYYLAGTGRYDTELIRITGGRVIGKMGAGGVYALSVPDERVGIAVKLLSGDMQATYAAVSESLRQLGLLTDNENRQLADYREPTLRNHHGAQVGSVEPCFTLR